MQAIHQLPHATLTPYVRCYWEWRHEVPSGETRHMPYGCTGRTHWVIFLDDSFQTRTTIDEGGHLATYDSMLMGQMLRPYTHHISTSLHMLVIDFTATGFYQLWSLPPGQFTGQNIEAELATGRSQAHLVDELRNIASAAARFDQIDTYLLNRLTRKKQSDNRIEAAANLIQQRAGNAQVRNVAQWVNCSERTLNRRFTETIGLSPKSYARVQRFLQTRNWVEQQSANHGGYTAEELGYYDQAHLINEFRYFSGKSPLVYGAAQKPLLDFMRER